MTARAVAVVFTGLTYSKLCASEVLRRRDRFSLVSQLDRFPEHNVFLVQFGYFENYCKNIEMIYLFT